MKFKGDELMIMPPQSAASRALARAHKAAKGLYAAAPGTGPQEETCKSCLHKTYSVPGNRKYLKCALVRRFWTGGPGTDIKAGSPACSKWEKRREDKA